jgi:hypothetical protein
MEAARLDAFRELVRQIKKATVDGLVFETQDVKILNEVTHRLSEVFTILRDAVKGVPIQNPELAALFAPLIQPPLEESEAVKMIYYLRRDLIMFPLTLDTERINSVPENNSMEEVEYGGAQV